ncbi:MAG: hypothetical protein U0168_30855 [Nannocystaceae bacterium]
MVVKVAASASRSGLAALLELRVGSTLGHVTQQLPQARSRAPARAVLADDDVAGLEVAVDQAGGVHRGEAAAGLGEHADDLGPAPVLARQPRLERLARDVLHRDPHATAQAADVEHHHEVAMGHPRERLGLAQHPSLLALGLGALHRAQQLDRHDPAQLGILRGIDHAHAASPMRSRAVAAMVCRALSSLCSVAGARAPRRRRRAVRPTATCW